jgi:DNA-binding IclR family transcriptional regulator
MDYSKQVPAAERTLNILEALSAEPEGLTAGDLLERLDLSRSALFALLNTLKARHYLEQVDRRGRYQLGPALWALIPGRQDGLGPLIKAFLADEKLQETAETVVLMWLDRQETVVLAQREGQHQVRAVFDPGERRPAPASAAGLALLAGLPPSAPARAALRQKVEAGDHYDLTTIRRQGTARRETAETVEMACPVCADGIRPVAALQVSTPHFRHDPGAAEALIKQVREAAARLSFRLGAAVYQPYGWAVGQHLGPNRPLDDDEIEQFLQGPWSARLACVRPDGAPHVRPLWYEWDGQCVWIAASPGAQWKEVVRESQRVSLTIDEPWPPLRRAFIVGRAERVAPEQAPGGLQGLRRRLAVRYLGSGAGQREELCQTEGWDAVRVTPQRISGQQGLGRA